MTSRNWIMTLRNYFCITVTVMMITLARLLLVENFLLEKNTGTKIRGTWLAKL